MRHFEILLVEDSPVDVELIREALRESKILHRLHTVDDGEKALDFLREEAPDLVLLDLNLPKKGGLEVLQEVKEDDRLKVVPVIILTNSRAEEDVIQAYQNYCNAYIRKPLGFEQIVHAIRACEKFWFEVVTLPNRPAQESVSLVTTSPPSKP